MPALVPALAALTFVIVLSSTTMLGQLEAGREQSLPAPLSQVPRNSSDLHKFRSGYTYPDEFTGVRKKNYIENAYPRQF